MPRRVEPVAERKAEVVGVQLDKGTSERGRSTEAPREGVCLKLKVATQNRHAERQKLNNANTHARLNCGHFVGILIFYR